MVVRTRLRSILAPFAFYLVLGVATGYLVWGASNGAHGLKAAEKDAAQAAALETQLSALKDERVRWERKVAALRPENVDRDLLDEEAHLQLDRIGRDEVVIFTAPKKAQ
jgi:cell division protein FtsB